MADALAADPGRGLAAAAALHRIGRRPGETVDFLARSLGRAHSTTVRLVDRLEAQGLVERRSGSDGRSLALELTAAGRRAVDATTAARAAVLDDVLAPLTPAERTVLERLLGTVLHALPASRDDKRRICRLCDVDACRRPSCPVADAIPA
jgi:MarR family transcriptional regulator, negative regulator of the multidrug operon emrRAB